MKPQRWLVLRNKRRFRIFFRHHGKQRTLPLGKVSRDEAEAKSTQIDYLLMRLPSEKRTNPTQTMPLSLPARLARPADHHHSDDLAGSPITNSLGAIDQFTNGVYQMKSIGSYEAKTHLPRLLSQVEKGETITITKRGKPSLFCPPPRQWPSRTSPLDRRVPGRIAKSRPASRLSYRRRNQGHDRGGAALSRKKMTVKPRKKG